MEFVTDDDIKAKEAELSALKAKKLAQENQPLAELAIRLHDVFCGYNHTDGCAWGYETRAGAGHEWGGQAHRRWMEYTERVIKEFDPIRILAFLNFMKEMG